jgi:tRNA-dependent cyclodipeptide synthase
MKDISITLDSNNKIFYDYAFSSSFSIPSSNKLNDECLYRVLEIDNRHIAVFYSKNYNLNIDNIRNLFPRNKIKEIDDSFCLFDNKINFDQILIDKSILTDNQDLLLKAKNKDLYAKVPLNSILEMPYAKSVDLTLMPTYKAHVCFVSPQKYRSTYVEYCDTPYFGISLENSNFTRAKLLASLEWISQRYKKCIVLIGDSIHRITLSSYYSDNKEDALSRALFLGREFLDTQSSVFNKFEDRCKFEFIFCSQIQNTKEYHYFYSIIKSLFVENVGFWESVIKSSESYHSKKDLPTGSEELQNLISCSCEYFLEEFAIFSFLYTKGYRSMIYPGSISTLAEIAEGLHYGSPEELKNLITISLHIKKR